MTKTLLFILLPAVIAGPSSAKERRTTALTELRPNAISRAKSAADASYWEREYGMGMIYDAQYNISLEVSDTEKAVNVIRKLLEASGGTANQGQVYYNAGAQVQTVSYTLPTEKAAPASKKILLLGDLTNYNTNKPYASAQLEEIEKKISEISQEIDSNAGALEKMPIARMLVTAKLNRLKTSRDAYRNGMGKAIVYITLTRPKG